MSGIFVVFFMFEAFLPKITQNLHQGFKLNCCLERRARGG